MVCHVHVVLFQWLCQPHRCRWQVELSIVCDVQSIACNANRFFHRFCNAWKTNSLCAEYEERVCCLKSNCKRKKSNQISNDLTLRQRDEWVMLCWMYLCLGHGCVPLAERFVPCHAGFAWWPIALYILMHISERSDSIRCDFASVPIKMGTFCGTCNSDCVSI